MNHRMLAVLAVGLIACGGATPSPASPSPGGAARASSDSSSVSGTEAAKTGDPFLLGSVLPDEPPAPSDIKGPDLVAWGAAASVAGVASAPPECAAFAQRKPSRKGVACEDRTAALLAVAEALEQVDVGGRDAALASLESCHGLPAGFARALRADLAPPECGDKIVDPWLASGASARATPPAIAHALVGQSIGARLARTVGKAPPMKGASDKKHVLAYVGGPLRAWIEGQARAVESLSRAGSSLASYGRGIAAVEAGLADMRFVERAREIPLPKEFEADEELKTAYYAALDGALGPRKDRGRDAALVGLSELAALGTLQDARVARARALLSKLYAGRRIDALDGLLLPPLPEASKLTVEERVAAKLPTFYVGLVLDEATLVQPTILRAALVQGLPASVRGSAAEAANAKAAGGALPPESTMLYARGRVELGKTYFRSFDFDAAARAAEPLRVGGDDKRSQIDTASLLVALGIALHDGPRDATALMQAASPSSLGIRQVGALDAVSGTSKGMAAYDAALLLGIAPPSGATASYFHDVARRFHAAAQLLAGPDKGAAEERAKVAEEIAAAAPR